MIFLLPVHLHFCNFTTIYLKMFQAWIKHIGKSIFKTDVFMKITGWCCKGWVTLGLFRVSIHFWMPRYIMPLKHNVWITLSLNNSARNRSKPNNVRKTSIIVSFGTNSPNKFVVLRVSPSIIREWMKVLARTVRNVLEHNKYIYEFIRTKTEMLNKFKLKPFWNISRIRTNWRIWHQIPFSVLCHNS